MSKEKKLFIVKVSLWVLFSLIIPVGFIGWRYDLFKKASQLRLSGWGLIAIIIIAVFLFSLTKYIKAGFIEWNLTKQIISGVLKIILPLFILLMITVNIKNNIDYFIQALSCVILSELVAIPINPFPKWVWEKSKGRFENTVDFIANKFYEKREDTNKGGGE